MYVCRNHDRFTSSLYGMQVDKYYVSKVMYKIDLSIWIYTPLLTLSSCKYSNPFLDRVRIGLESGVDNPQTVICCDCPVESIQYLHWHWIE